jgi:hypothetical protein
MNYDPSKEQCDAPQARTGMIAVRCGSRILCGPKQSCQILSVQASLRYLLHTGKKVPMIMTSGK